MAENMAGFPIFGTIDRVTITGMGTGLTVDANAHVFVRESNLSQNSTGVLLQNSGFPGNPDAVLEHNLITNNNGGVQVNVGWVRLTSNTISENGDGIVPGGGGTVYSFGNNVISGNYAVDYSPPNALSPLPLK
jgi:hypothetical protein